MWKEFEDPGDVIRGQLSVISSGFIEVFTSLNNCSSLLLFMPIVLACFITD